MDKITEEVISFLQDNNYVEVDVVGKEMIFRKDNTDVHVVEHTDGL